MRPTSKTAATLISRTYVICERLGQQLVRVYQTQTAAREDADLSLAVHSFTYFVPAPKSCIKLAAIIPDAAGANKLPLRLHAFHSWNIVQSDKTINVKTGKMRKKCFLGADNVLTGIFLRGFSWDGNKQAQQFNIQPKVKDVTFVDKRDMPIMKKPASVEDVPAPVLPAPVEEAPLPELGEDGEDLVAYTDALHTQLSVFFNHYINSLCI